MGTVGNGGYSQDKKYIDKCFDENKEEHTRMETQNSTDHKAIKDELAQIRNVYIQDVIIVKTKVNGLIWAVVLLTPPAAISLFTILKDLVVK